MLKPATGLYIWASLGVVFALACLAECEICPLEGNIKNSVIGFQNTFLSYLGLDHGHGCQSKFLDNENVCCSSELCSFRSTLYDSHLKERCSSGKFLSGTGFSEQSSKQDSNVSWLSNEFLFDFLDGLTLACLLDGRWLDHEIFTPIVNNTAQIVLFHGRGHLLYKRDAAFTLPKIEIEKSSSTELPSPCLSISPKKLDWGENYIYHPSSAFLRIKNICNENVIKVYEPFTTDSQFYPFNCSEVVLGPGEVISITFIFLPKLLGLSSAELVLETSLGGFLVQAKGRVIESPYRLVPLVGLDVFSLGEWLSLNLSLSTPFDEAIYWGENVVFDDTLLNINVNFDSFVEMANARMSCRIQILANDSSSSYLEVPCHDIFRMCPRRQPELLPHLLGVADRSYRTYSLRSAKSTSVLTKTTGRTEVDESVLQKGRDQNTMSGLYVLTDHELVFPLVEVDKHFAKSFTVKNPSHQPVKVQLILNSGETVDNCKLNNNTDILSPWSTNLGNNKSTSPTKYGFSIMESTVTEAFLPAFGAASLGPIFFHPSSRCEWKSSALIRNNLSGVELLSLRGFGGLLSLVLLEDANIKQKLHFDMNLPSLNMSFPINTPSIDEMSSVCRTPLSKKLFALNAGDFGVKVERISVSGTKCGLQGFSVHNCEGFALEPGESIELGISYQTDFSGSPVKRDLEIKLASGMLVLPMQASIPMDILNLCKKSIFWVQVKVCCIAMFLAAVLMFLLFWFIIMLQTDSVDYLIKGDKRSIPVVRPKEKVTGKSVKVTKMSHFKSVQRDNSRHGNVKNGIVLERSDCKTDVSSYATTENSFSPTFLSKWNEIESKVMEVSPVCLTVRTRKEKRRRPKKRGVATSGLMAHLEVSSSQSGNSTPSSPLSPITTPSPKNTRPLSRDSSGYRSENAKASQKSVGPKEVSYTQQPFCPDLTGTRPMLLTSATFPGTGRCDIGPLCSYPSRLSISPHARAPGPMKPQKAVQADERTTIAERFTYDIWGNHFPGLLLMDRSEGSVGMMSEYIKGHSGSFFVRDPQQTLLTNYAPAPVTMPREKCFELLFYHEVHVQADGAKEGYTS